MAHQAGAYPGFCSMKRLGVFLLPPGWDASPLQGYPTILNLPVLIYTPEWKECPLPHDLTVATKRHDVLIMCRM